MKYLLTILLASLYTIALPQSRTEFNYSDSSFAVGQVKIINNFIWECSYPLSVASEPCLDSLETFLKTHEDIKIKIAVHTDMRGSKEFNQKLTEKRSKAIVDYLVSLGISKDRLMPEGFGESMPLISEEEIGKMSKPEDMEAAHQKNRRVEFWIIEL